MPREDDRLRHVLTKSITAAINEIGLDAFKRTSLFMSNKKEN